MDTPDGESWHRIGGRHYCGSKAVSDDELKGMESTLGKAEASALPVEQWIKDQQALVILGDPGSGKSTTMKRLALGFAQCENAPLPILLPLNAYSKALEKQDISFEEYLSEYFDSKLMQLDKGKLSRLFTEALKQQKAIILMDGLDEVGDNRGKLVGQVESFVRAWIPDPESKQSSGNRMIVTSRFVGYDDYPLTDPRWKKVALSDWGIDEIGRFFKAFTLASELAWSGGEDKQDAHKKAQLEHQYLIQVVEHNKGIRRLSGNPLLASLLVLIKRQGITLPHQRVELYNIYMKTLLTSWNKSRSLDEQPVGPEIVFGPTQKLLAKLALHLRQIDPKSGLIDEEAMRTYLESYYREDDYSRKEAEEKTNEFLRSVHEYSSLLIKRGHKEYGFIHLTIEEYLAGFGLSLEREKKLHKLMVQHLESPEHWKETLLLCFGAMAVIKTEDEKANTLLEGLLEKNKPQYTLFTGEVLNDVGHSVLGNRMTRKIKKSLLTLMQDKKVEIPLRAKAGRELSLTGDPRAGVAVQKEHPKLPDIDWQLIPNDSFTMGTEGEEGYSDEKPDHPVTLESFYISRYPVTNAQYRCFIEAGMYEDHQFWEEKLPKAAGMWHKGEMIGEELIETYPEENREAYRDWLKNDKDRVQPKYWMDKTYNPDNHPVVGVSWFEALAYCVWLNEQLEAVKPDVKGSQLTIRLPTEAEWEYAARGTTNLRYAWGDDPAPLMGNYSDTGLARTSPVGMFPKGQAFDLYDMSGNVWEWTSSRWGNDFSNPDFTYKKWKKQEKKRDLLDPVDLRILRGGSWFDTSVNVRCAFRNGYHPYIRDVNCGFRLVCSE